MMRGAQPRMMLEAGLLRIILPPHLLMFIEFYTICGNNGVRRQEKRQEKRRTITSLNNLRSAKGKWKSLRKYLGKTLPAKMELRKLIESFIRKYNIP